jgi:hypothetical protein
MAGKVYRLGDTHGMGSKGQDHQPVAGWRAHRRAPKRWRWVCAKASIPMRCTK